MSLNRPKFRGNKHGSVQLVMNRQYSVSVAQFLCSLFRSDAGGIQEIPIFIEGLVTLVCTYLYPIKVVFSPVLVIAISRQ